ncbi:sulfite exporter TauE/SafE family protein [Alteromonas sp. ASW11-19]|uniref:Probable membrane transporter protein n=1 Tax=Alteromonas salexigens TaxID=2982530 RepID=A0ABT2VJK0_9ALTE|nr:sulfite exporter TauE/SafE family protein [Alteromonas salexigens]MCU7553407.1 sulfite exporter TauE/SafE family protein [Alteromonas salexigens]
MYDTLLTLFTAGHQISGLVAAGLILLAALTSLMTASLGIGGGVLLLGVMATVMPVAALIPVHGLVQFGSNANRAALTRRHTDWRMVGWFCLGAVVGASVATLLVIQLPLQVIQLAVALFILFLVWGSKPKTREMRPLGRSLAGAITTFLSMFVGATGPLVAAFVHRNGYHKLQITATFASCMTFQHLLKLGVFSAVGFHFLHWLPLLVAMIASGFAGTWLGLKLLNRISTAGFVRVFKWLLTLLALRLLWYALVG